MTKNEVPNYQDQIQEDKNWFVAKLDNYSETNGMNHGFQDPKEAERFENLMSTYQVDTVYLSHIHSYLEYAKDGVRYLISGGAGAELLTENSYYHYLVAQMKDPKALMMVELPSPANYSVARYTATVKLFAKAMYQENQLAVILLLIAFVLLVALLILKLYVWRRNAVHTFGTWLVDTGKFAAQRFRTLFNIQKKDK